MIKNYLKATLRHIKRDSVLSILNISGMAIGMASAFLILLWVQDERSFDSYHKNADNLYRVLQNFYSDNEEPYPVAVTQIPLIPALKEGYPEIIRASRYQIYPVPLKKGDIFVNEVFAFVDKDFLEMFNIQFVQGDKKSALAEPHNIIITEEIAEKYFRDEAPLGKTLLVKGHALTITGVAKCMPPNSHLQFGFLVPVGFLTEFRGTNMNSWRGSSIYSYIELLEGTDSKLVDKKIRDITSKYNKELHTTIFLQNIKRIHLFSAGKIEKDISGNGDIAYVRMLILIAVFILIIACINFTNLSTAQYAARAKEIGVRKVAGANRKKIFTQFIGESLLVVFMALIIAIILVELLLPGFNNLTGKQLYVNFKSIELYIGLITTSLCCGFLSGSYPAFYLSSLKPVITMKGSISQGTSKVTFRRVLVIFQFSLSVLLIICTVIIGNQLNFMQDKNLGFNKENIGYIQLDSPKAGEVLKKELSNIPDILSISLSDQNPCSVINGGPSSMFSWEGKKGNGNVIFSVLGVDEDFANTFQLEMKQGRFFSPEFSTDNNAMVINEQAANIMGFNDPIGQTIDINGPKFKIIGVVKDFNFKSLHTKIEPLIMSLNKNAIPYCFIRIEPDNINSTVDNIYKSLKTLNLQYPVEFKFLDDFYKNLYQKEQRMSKIFRYFTFLAILISCLGLYALSSYMTELRTKEIGIRKINGAKSFTIFSLLSSEYIILVIISILIASPIAWYGMNKWLQNFAFQVNISWWAFAMAGVIAILIAFLTVCFQTYRASSKNPVEALRYE